MPCISLCNSTNRVHATIWTTINSMVHCMKDNVRERYVVVGVVVFIIIVVAFRFTAIKQGSFRQLQVIAIQFESIYKQCNTIQPLWPLQVSWKHQPYGPELMGHLKTRAKKGKHIVKAMKGKSTKENPNTYEIKEEEEDRCKSKVKTP